jgi:hypothetical protein
MIVASASWETLAPSGMVTVVVDDERDARGDDDLPLTDREDKRLAQFNVHA